MAWKTCVIICGECNVPFERLAVGRARVIYCDACRKEKNEVKRNAASALARALRKGLVRAAEGQMCADCGAAAHSLEHRDYTRPLMVEPVCRSCNHRRPPAKWRLHHPMPPPHKRKVRAPSQEFIAPTAFSDAPDCAAITLVAAA